MNVSLLRMRRLGVVAGVAIAAQASGCSNRGSDDARAGAPTATARGEGARMVESLPGAVASALPSFASGVAGSVSAFSGNDLVVAVDDKDQDYFGLAPQGKPATQVPRSMFSAVVRDGAAVPARLEDNAVLKLVRVVPGVVARAIVVALSEHWKTTPQAVFSTVGWRVSDNAVIVMLAPARGDADKSVIGGATSMGQEVHYHIDAKTFAILRRTFAR